MSTATSRRVWEESKQSGSALLILLSMADRSDDDGYCWPGMEDIAQRARINKRHAQRLVSAIENDGELYAERSSGRGRTSQYIVTTGQNQTQIANTLTRRFEMDAVLAVATAARIVQQRDRGKGDIHAQTVTPAPPIAQNGNGDIYAQKVTPTPPFAQNGKGDIHAQTVTPAPPQNPVKVTPTRENGDTHAIPTVREPKESERVSDLHPSSVEKNTPTHSLSEAEQKMSVAILTDPDILMMNPAVVARLAAQYPFDEIRRFCCDLYSEGREPGSYAGLVEYRLTNRATLPPLRHNTLWARHRTPDEIAQAQQQETEHQAIMDQRQAADRQNAADRQAAIAAAGLDIFNLWDQTMAQLTATMPPQTVATWLTGAQAQNLTDGTLTVKASHAHARDWLTARLRPQVNRTLAQLAGQPITVHFTS